MQMLYYRYNAFLFEMCVNAIAHQVPQLVLIYTAYIFVNIRLFSPL